jgi:hypothetical protein
MRPLTLRLKTTKTSASFVRSTAYCDRSETNLTTTEAYSSSSNACINTNDIQILLAKAVEQINNNIQQKNETFQKYMGDKKFKLETRTDAF